MALSRLISETNFEEHQDRILPPPECGKAQNAVTESFKTSEFRDIHHGNGTKSNLRLNVVLLTQPRTAAALDSGNPPGYSGWSPLPG